VLSSGIKDGLRQQLAAVHSWTRSQALYAAGRTDCRSLYPPVLRRAAVLNRDGRRRTVHLRPGTSDMACFTQIFHAEHYRIPAPGQDKCARAEFAAILARGAKPLIIDCGANIGLSAVYLADAWPGAKVVAIEPEPANLAMLRSNTADLDVDVVAAAVSDTPGRFALADPAAESWAHQTRATDDGDIEGVTIGGILERYPVGDFAPFLVKIDIEGGEADLFRSNLEWVDEFCVMVVELHDWMKPSEANSANFLRAVAGRDRDFIYANENVFSLRNQTRSTDRVDPLLPRQNRVALCP